MMEDSSNNIELIDNIKKAFLESVDPISKSELIALREFPTQFVTRVDTEDGWTTQLHIWAEQGVDEILDLDPIYFIVKDSDNETLLSSLVKGALGLYTDMVDYTLIEKILDKDFNYETFDGDDLIVKNALDEKNGDGDNSIDVLIDFAWSQGEYEDTDEDPKLQEILKEFAVKYRENQEYIKELTEEINADEEDTSDQEKNTDADD
jgi:hypothetical protein